MFGNKPVSRADIESFIYKWNNDYPIDRWWREKHKVSFNSPAHRVVSFLDMYIEWTEDQIFDKVRTNTIKNHNYTPGDWLTEKEISQVDINKEIEEFSKMDLSKFDDHGR